MSGGERSGHLIVLPAPLAHILDALEVLTAPDMPAIAVIGGTGVNIRLSTSAAAHRATPDIDIVADEREPPTVEVLTQLHEQLDDHTVLVAGLEVEIIPTYGVTEQDIEGLDDGDRLFLAGHRWALETASPVRLTALGNDGRELTVCGHGRRARRRQEPCRRLRRHGPPREQAWERPVRPLPPGGGVRHGGDLRDELAAAPRGIGRDVAQVVQAEILSSPARAMRQMAPSSPTPLVADHIVDVFEPFVEVLVG